MVQAIGAASAAAYGAAPSGGGTQAQLQKLEKILSECVNCASAKTPEGQAQIQAVSARIHALRERIAQPGEGQPAEAQPTDRTGPKAAVNGLGGVVDVFA